MKNIIAILGMLCLIPLMFIATANPANAEDDLWEYGCGSVLFNSSTTAWVGGDNQKIAGRPLKWTFTLRWRECNGYDLVTKVAASLSKDGTGCQTIWASNDGYNFNPNSLGGVNAGVKWTQCVPSAGSYAVNFPAYEGTRINSGMSSDARCLNFTFSVDLNAQNDPEFNNADPLCLNGG